jgi:hypothetical protein
MAQKYIAQAQHAAPRLGKRRRNFKGCALSFGMAAEYSWR